MVEQDLKWYAPLIAAMFHMVVVILSVWGAEFLAILNLSSCIGYSQFLLLVVIISYAYILFVHRYSRNVKKIIHWLLGGIGFIVVGWGLTFVFSIHNFGLSFLFTYSYLIPFFWILIVYDGKEG